MLTNSIRVDLFFFIFSADLPAMHEWPSRHSSDLGNLTDCDTSSCVILTPEDLLSPRMWLTRREAFSALNVRVHAQNVHVDLEHQCSEVPLMVFTHDNYNIGQGLSAFLLVANCDLIFVIKCIFLMIMASSTMPSV